MSGHAMNRPSLLKLLVGVGCATGMLLLIPLVAMQFTDEVSWTPGDFIVAAGLLFGAGAAIAAGIARRRKPVYRLVIVALVALGLAVVWVELAVGVLP